ncbi:MAG: phenylalanyl-tRNA synthetase beta chain [Solirubrobacteraceae bacterium]|nr:phenylalanyl-tRNA synthetase beta chain [Solirubrobacteraceae bacterium]
MRVPVDWLHDYVRPDLGLRELAERLALTGTEVDGIHPHGVGAVDGFVVGVVLSAEQHPDADRLRVCIVDVGDGEPSQIVCGAPNVAAGQTVAVARPGAVMPDGTTLGKAKLRGVESAGMVLAEDEVALGSDHDGIMVLADGPAPGTPLIEVLPIRTDVLDLEITPNRPDCLGIYGVAREVHAATGAPLKAPPWARDPHPAGDGIPGVSVEVRDPDLCPRFTLRAFDNVTIGPSPLWLKARLSAAGQRPINNVIDISNYVMLLTAQPLHAFDWDRVAGGSLVVRRAGDGEKMTTLDDIERTLDSDMVVIDDADGPTSIAGVMGGQRSEVSEETTRVLIEIATWNGPNINRTSNRLGLRSEASSRFEKGLSVRQTMEAQAVASQLMVDLCGATPVGGTIDVGGPGPDPAPIRLRSRRVTSLLGTEIPVERQAEILHALDFDTSPAPDGLDVTPPHVRRDVTREADVIEEVARLDGVDKLPATLPARRRVAAARLTHEQRVRRRAEDAMVGCGLFEIAGWSFTDPAVLDRLRLPADSPLRAVVTLENPLSEAQSILRPTILPSLLDAARRNVARGMPDVGLFESGTVYRAADELADEHHALAALVSGRRIETGFFHVKGILEAVLGTLRVDWSVEAGQWPFLHPGRAAAVLVGGERVGWIGEVHPLVARSWEIDQTVSAFAVDLGKVAAAAPEVTTYRDLTSFPSLRQDLAVVVDAGVRAADVLAAVREAGGELLAAAEVFDVYTGEQVGEGRVSLALHLEFRAPDRTLSDEDVAPVHERIVAALREGLGGELRG